MLGIKRFLLTNSPLDVSGILCVEHSLCVVFTKKTFQDIHCLERNISKSDIFCLVKPLSILFLVSMLYNAKKGKFLSINCMYITVQFLGMSREHKNAIH